MSHIGLNMLNHKKVRGFSLVEMMVAVVIGLIGTVIIFQVFAVSEGQKRTTVSGGDAQQNGGIALFSVERELRNAGNGLTQLIARGVPIYGWNNLTGAARPALIMRQVTITKGATSDTIDINYATYAGLTAPVKVTSPAGSWNPASVAPGNILSVASVVGFNNGDKIVVCPPIPDPAGPPPGPAEDTCIMAEISGFGPGDRIFVDPPPAEFSVYDSGLDTSKFNPPAGFGVLIPTLALDGRALPATYGAGTGSIKDALVYNMGNALVGRRYAVDVANSRMTVDDGSGSGPQEFADGVIAIRAQYGLDTSATLDGVVDVWVNPKSVPANALADNTPDHPSCVTTTAAGIANCWPRVQAVRVAIVTRSGVLEKTEVETRSSIPLWTNPTGNPVPGPSFAVAAGDARRYRYKVFETIVPLRNMIWQVHRPDTTGD
jgi:type IV pilus assembly protein PilW